MLKTAKDSLSFVVAYYSINDRFIVMKVYIKFTYLIYVMRKQILHLNTMITVEKTLKIYETVRNILLEREQMPN